MYKHLKDKKGYTMVELLVVLVISTILAGAAIPSCIGLINKSNKTICQIHRDQLWRVISAQYMYTDTEFDIGQKIDIDPDATDDGFGYADYACPDGGTISYKIDADGTIAIICSEHGSTTGRMPALNQASVNEMFNILSDLRVSDIDSTAVDGINRNKALEAFASAGLDMNAMGAVSWRYQGGSDSEKRIEWTTADVAALPVGTSIPVMRYRINGVYSVWKGTVAVNSSGIHIIKINNGTEYAASGSMNMDDKKVLDSMVAIFNQAAMDTGYPTITR